MRLDSRDGRGVVLPGGEAGPLVAWDVAELSEGRIGPDPMEMYAAVDMLRGLAAGADHADALAGVTMGQDLSERDRQLRGPAPQFGLAKSFPGFSPIGPWVVTLDDAPALDDLGLGCAVDGDVVQDGTTAKLLYPVVRAIAELSRVLTFQPGDLVFTGTPDGVGMARRPPRYLRSGQTLTSWVGGIGRMQHRLVAE